MGVFSLNWIVFSLFFSFWTFQSLSAKILRVYKYYMPFQSLSSKILRVYNIYGTGYMLWKKQDATDDQEKLVIVATDDFSGEFRFDPVYHNAKLQRIRRHPCFLFIFGLGIAAGVIQLALGVNSSCKKKKKNLKKRKLFLLQIFFFKCFSFPPFKVFAGCVCLFYVYVWF